MLFYSSLNHTMALLPPNTALAKSMLREIIMCDESVISCVCENVDHNRFNRITEAELKKPIIVNDIANEEYCISIAFKFIDDECLSANTHQ